MKNNNAFIVAASENYTQGLQALLNSINIYHPEDRVIILSYDLSNEFIDRCRNLYAKVLILKLEKKVTQSHDTAFERFIHAYEITKKFDAICLLDADMFLTANCDLFFNMAAKGFIVTGSNGMVFNFNKAYQEKYEIKLSKDNYIYPKVHTTVPVFINKENTDWFKTWYEYPRLDTFDDFTFLNMVGAFLEKNKNMLCMPPYTFTGIHHWQMKPETAVFERGDILLSGTEEQVYMVHGKWWWEGWLQDLWPTMEKYCKDNQIGDKGRFKIKEAIKLLKKKFNYYYNYK